ncbi:MAG: hypothetical protein ACRCW3_02650 [Metamycoplasmataceae bacterium]
MPREESAEENCFNNINNECQWSHQIVTSFFSHFHLSTSLTKDDSDLCESV